MNSFKVSVIIPIYNAINYLEQAVMSAINLQETGEVILVDDTSTDGSYERAFELSMKFPNIVLIPSLSHINQGPSFVRNQGIKVAKHPFIAFLDADDYYLPNRFETDKLIFEANKDAGAVYGCNQAVFETENAKTLFYKTYPSEYMTTTQTVGPEKLFKSLLFGGQGRFHISTITIKKELLEYAGMFNENLRYAEDSELWLKLSLVGNVVAGNILTPVSIRRVHDNNSIHNIRESDGYKKRMYQYLFDWVILKHFGFEVKNDAFRGVYQFIYDSNISIRKLLQIQIKRNPAVMFTSFFYKKVFNSV